MNVLTILIIFMTIILIYAMLISLFQILFRITGLTRHKAFFQTISLLTAVGFTTSESETITSNPFRRKIAIAAMIIGNLLSVAVISILVETISTFDAQTIEENWIVLLIASGVFLLILIIFSCPFVRKPLENLIERIGYNIFAKKSGGNIITILDNYGEDSICEIVVNHLPDVLKNRTLFESGIKDQYSVNVMFVRRKNVNITINKDTIIQEGDEIVAFGNKKLINTLFSHVTLTEEDKKDINESISNDLFIIENYSDKAMVEVVLKVLPYQYNGETIFESDFRKVHDINIMLIKRDNDVISISQDTKLEIGDTIIMFGPYKNIKYLFGRVETPIKNIDEDDNKHNRHHK